MEWQWDGYKLLAGNTIKSQLRVEAWSVPDSSPKTSGISGVDSYRGLRVQL